MPSPRILLTGGAGYIGSHTFVALHEAGFGPVILDNFANSHPAVLQRLEKITGRAPVLERVDVLVPLVWKRCCGGIGRRGWCTLPGTRRWGRVWTSRCSTFITTWVGQSAFYGRRRRFIWEEKRRTRERELWVPPSRG